MCVKQFGKTNTVLLHSKLTSKQWPNIKNVLEKIVSNLPLVNIQLHCYDREKESVQNLKKQKNNQNKESNEFKISKYDKMKVNVYLLKIPQINQLSKSTAEGNYNQLKIKLNRSYVSLRP